MLLTVLLEESTSKYGRILYHDQCLLPLSSAKKFSTFFFSVIELNIYHGQNKILIQKKIECLLKMQYYSSCSIISNLNNEYPVIHRF